MSHISFSFNPEFLHENFPKACRKIGDVTKALYRRYRPETFQEVIGQAHVTAPLMAALAAGHTTHAYLFSGPRGCGKTTSARILARCLNCEQYPTDTPCGVCESCKELAREGSGSLDVVELDAASHGGVDDARELREQASFAPVRDRFKIYIIDEAHMVSNQGFNALLKLVEEPPPHIKFIFATTEPEKVIGTIRSRTHHYPFHLVPPSTLENYLAQICADENVTAGKDVLSLVVRAGTGSVRDTLSVLDQIIGGSDGSTLEYDRAVALLGYTSAHLLDSAISAIASGDGGALFGVVDSVVKSGHDPRRFVEDLLQRLRDVVIIALAGTDVKDVFLSVPDDQYALMLEQAESLGARAASRAADLVNEALTAMVGATAPRMQLELLCARLIVAQQPAEYQRALSDSEESLSLARTITSQQHQNQPYPSRTTAAQPSKEQFNLAKPHKPQPQFSSIPDPRMEPMPNFADIEMGTGATVENPTPKADIPGAKREPEISEQQAVHVQQKTAANHSGAGKDSGSADLLSIQQAWEKIVANASAHSKIVENMLKHASGPLALNDGTLVVGFENDGTAAGFNRHQRAQTALAEAVAGAVGLQLRLEGRTGSANSDVYPKDRGPSGTDLADINLPISDHSRSHPLSTATSGNASSESPFHSNSINVSDDTEYPAATHSATPSAAHGLENLSNPKDLNHSADLPQPIETHSLHTENSNDAKADVTNTEENSAESEDSYNTDELNTDDTLNDSESELHDPAGVLAALVDGQAVIHPGRSYDADVDSPQKSSAVTASFSDEHSEDATAEGPMSRAATPSSPFMPDLPEIPDLPETPPAFNDSPPFYTQDLPDLPPLDMPPVSKHSTVSPSSLLEQRARSLAAAASSSTEEDSFFPSAGTLSANAENNADFSPEFTESSEKPPVFSDEWEEVSPDDPEISQSSLVGINVVLETFGASVVEVIPNDSEKGN